MPPAPGDLYRGQRIGKFEVLTQLSVGGMAELLLAFHRGPGGFRKFVVIKRILPDIRADEKFVQMFLDEARITAAFSHPNIAQVFDLDEDPEDGLYLAMEFIAGQNVNQIQQACLQRRTAFPIGLSVRIARDVCLALHYAHTFTDPTGRPIPVLHRDVAQKNVMVAYDGAVKLLDFGIAKVRGQLGRTAGGMVKGTTGYMSPEQVRGEELDGRSDVFSVGVMLHELLTGRRLFAAQTEVEEMQLILTSPIRRADELNPMVPEPLADVSARALARERADRFGSARELARALEQACSANLFDDETAAAFMREAFEGKLVATRALLDSAGEQDPEAFARTVARVVTDPGISFEPAPSAARAAPGLEVTDRAAPVVEPEDERTPRSPPVLPSVARQGPPVLAPPAAGGKTPGRPVRRRGLEELALAGARGGTERVEVASDLHTVHVETQPWFGALWGLLVLAVLVGGGLVAWNLIFAPPEPGQEEGAPVAAQGAPASLPDFDELRGSGRRPPQDLAAQAPPAAVPLEPEPSPARAGGGKARAASAKGTLTLITTPECRVRLGRRDLGQTPLFSVPLPAGTHLLTLEGTDGTKRSLSAPIVEKQNTAFRVKLGELPAAR